MNLEIPLPIIWKWVNTDEPVPASMGREIVDFVVNKSNSPVKREQDIWAIVELKRHNDVGGDRWKLTTKILPHFPDCAFGLAIGLAEMPADDWLEHEAKKEGLKLVRSESKNIRGRDFVGFAYIHENRQRGR